MEAGFRHRGGWGPWAGRQRLNAAREDMRTGPESCPRFRPVRMVGCPRTLCPRPVQQRQETRCGAPAKCPTAGLVVEEALLEHYVNRNVSVLQAVEIGFHRFVENSRFR